MEARPTLRTADYAVIVAMLFIPLGIGVFFAIRDVKRSTRDEYLLGGRRMAMLPVALSLFASFQSAISLLGFPAEIYMYGPMIFATFIGLMLTYVLTYFTLVPLLFPLQLTSIYEYVEMKFESKAVRMLSTIMGIVQTFFYMTISLLAPGLALEAAAGIPLWVSVAIVGVTGTIYTAAGGIKSVIWTDVFQTLISFIGVYGAIIISVYHVGGIQKAFEINQTGGRTRFDSISLDPRVRQTWWTSTTGGAFMWFSQMTNQTTIQRITSMKTLRGARRAMLLNVPLTLFIGVTVVLMGWSLYAYLHHIRCDPVQAGILTNYNQLAPFYVIHALYGIPGMAGLYMSALFSAALSTLSSGLNALATNTVEDVLKKPMTSLSEKTATTVTKVTTLIYGIAAMSMAYLAKSLQGPVTQMSSTVAGIFGGCNVGIIALGCTVPWANKFGAMSGAVVSLTLNLWLGIGSRLYGRPTQPLAPVPSDHCFSSTIEQSKYLNQTYRDVAVYSTNHSLAALDQSDQLPDDFSLYDLSYHLYSFTGVTTCYLVGLLVSLITKSKVKTCTDPKLIFGCLRRFWNLNQQRSVVDYEVSLSPYKEDAM